MVNKFAPFRPVSKCSTPHIACESQLLETDVHLFDVRVYYENTDHARVVNNGEYLRFLERARTEYLRVCHIRHRELEAMGLYFAVYKLDITYAAPAFIDDILTICTKITHVTPARVLMHQLILRDGQRICEADVTVVTINQGYKLVRLPGFLQEKLRPYVIAQR